MRLIVIASVCFNLLLALSAHAHFTAKGHVHSSSQQHQDFFNDNCRQTESCDLKRFTLTSVQNEIWFSDDPLRPTYANGAIMEYETDQVAALERYAIVQFVKGCVYHTYTHNGGRDNMPDTVKSFGEYVPFCFSRWVIDSQDRDPVYNSDPQYGRIYLARWNKPGSYDQRTQKFYGQEKPHRPIVYLSDHPAGAFVTGTGVKNAAL